MNCQKCNFQNEDNAQFCGNCGAKLWIKPHPSPIAWILFAIVLIVCGILGVLLYNANEKLSTIYEIAIEEVTTTTDPGIVINGVKWATRNVDEPGTFANSPESAGKFYQWNSHIGSAAKGDYPFVWCHSPMNDKDYWGRSTDPSPLGWRVPTYEQIETLFDTEKVSSKWITQNGINGTLFTDLITNNSMFLPAVGMRGSDRGLLGVGGDSQFYWSSTVASVSHEKGEFPCAYGILLHLDRCSSGWTDGQLGLPIRSVKEER
ncbi:hypothetical protein AGMMS49525_09350 [Bacteroidia bacterium]|nr:hypothetical protein AGMMS49525_09350 [Bacteroidia bacterium]